MDLIILSTTLKSAHSQSMENIDITCIFNVIAAMALLLALCATRA